MIPIYVSLMTYLVINLDIKANCDICPYAETIRFSNIDNCDLHLGLCKYFYSWATVILYLDLEIEYPKLVFVGRILPSSTPIVL